MADNKTPAAATTEPSKPSAVKKIALMTLAALALAGGSALGALYLNGSLGKAGHGGEAVAATVSHDAPAAAGKGHEAAQYLPIDPPFVVNFEDQGVLRYLQVSLSVMTRDKLILDAVTNHMPPIRDNLILLFGSQSFETLNSIEGKEKLREQALASIQKILKEEIGQPGVEAVYFTNFVMQ